MSEEKCRKCGEAPVLRRDKNHIDFVTICAECSTIHERWIPQIKANKAIALMDQCCIACECKYDGDCDKCPLGKAIKMLKDPDHE